MVLTHPCLKNLIKDIGFLGDKIFIYRRKLKKKVAVLIKKDLLKFSV